MRYLELPAAHVSDWLERCRDEFPEADIRIWDRTERKIFLTLSNPALEDLISDALYTADVQPDPGVKDHRPAARRLLARLEQLGITWQRTTAVEYDVELTA